MATVRSRILFLPPAIKQKIINLAILLYPITNKKILSTEFINGVYSSLFGVNIKDDIKKEMSNKYDDIAITSCINLLTKFMVETSAENFYAALREWYQGYHAKQSVNVLSKELREAVFIIYGKLPASEKKTYWKFWKAQQAEINKAGDNQSSCFSKSRKMSSASVLGALIFHPLNIPLLYFMAVVSLSEGKITKNCFQFLSVLTLIARILDPFFGKSDKFKKENTLNKTHIENILLKTTLGKKFDSLFKKPATQESKQASDGNLTAFGFEINPRLILVAPINAVDQNEDADDLAVAKQITGAKSEAKREEVAAVNPAPEQEEVRVGIAAPLVKKKLNPIQEIIANRVLERELARELKERAHAENAARVAAKAAEAKAAAEARAAAEGAAAKAAAEARASAEAAAADEAQKVLEAAEIRRIYGLTVFKDSFGISRDCWGSNVSEPSLSLLEGRSIFLPK